MALTVWLVIFILMFALGYPIALGMFVSSTFYMVLSGLDLQTVMDVMVISFENHFVLLAVPLFVFTAKAMNAGLLTDRLFDFAKILVGPLKGGLGHVNIVASIIFAGMSGSEVADVAGLGAVEIKAMKDSGYDGPFSCAVTCASATIGPIIPPSIPMVIYSMISGASVGYLFLGGILPGFLLGGILMVLVYILSVRRNYPSGQFAPPRVFFRVFIQSLLILMAPVILLGGIYGGVFTPTEAAGVVGGVCHYTFDPGISHPGFERLVQCFRRVRGHDRIYQLHRGLFAIFRVHCGQRGNSSVIDQWFFRVGIDGKSMDRSSFHQFPAPGPGLLYRCLGHPPDCRTHRFTTGQTSRYRPCAFRRGSGFQPDDRAGHASPGRDGFYHQRDQRNTPGRCL